MLEENINATPETPSWLDPTLSGAQRLLNSERGTYQKGRQDYQGTSLGILNAIILKANNGASESINSRINMIKIRSRSFRNKARYRNAIYFHLGERDLYPKRFV